MGTFSHLSSPPHTQNNTLSAPMIQQTNARRPPSTVASPEQSGSSEGPEIWGKWSGRKHYSLEVVQHPLRARMCGFGDKDRRPLAPAAVAKMIVRSQDKSLVDVDEIDWSFFLVTVDLWSADGKQEMNLVLHPSSADRYMPTPSSKNRRRGTSITQQQQLSGHQTPIQPSPVPSYRPNEQAPSTPLPSYASHQGYFASAPAESPYASSPTYSQQGSGSPWGYTSTGVDRSTTYPPPILPSIHTFAAATSGPHSWNGADNYHAVGDAKAQLGHDANSVFASSPYAQHQAIQISTSHSQHSGYAPPYTASVTPTPSTSGANFGHTPGSHSFSNNSNMPWTAGYPPMTSPRLAYTRTLVGPLSSNACRLQDEHRKPGIFFLFQDLSVRTEGTFRLRMRLMNVGAPPAPEYGSTRVHTDVSPVLAQTFTEPFTVFSAKRFPGVPDTTALSIAFGNQGQKLPLRNRHGSAKRRRRGGSSSAEEEDSEEAE